TGICNHAYTGTAYEKECCYCRFLNHPGKKDLSYKTFVRKQEIYKNADVCFVAVSHWLAEKARCSALLQGKCIKVIPNTLSPSQFVIMDKAESRKHLGLPDKNIIIFGAARIDDSIKGFPLLVGAMKYLVEMGKIQKESLHLVLFGNIKSDRECFLSAIPVSYTYAGVVSADQLACFYSASDVVVSSSYYETFGQTLIEAQACGCLSVSWNNSGQSDIIRHKENGFLAEYLSQESLAEGVLWALTEGKDNISREDLRTDVINRFSEENVARQTIELYKSLV
ncbi:MAG: glycosyltransferase, partial [Prevotellaceae bacterium]|nr:glycosyltransferase [Prevotellaceae bacterium]